MKLLFLKLSKYCAFMFKILLNDMKHISDAMEGIKKRTGKASMASKLKPGLFSSVYIPRKEIY